MMVNRAFFAALFVIFSGLVVHADDALQTLTGACSIAASSQADQVEFRLKRGECENSRNCNSSETSEPISAFTGFTLTDLQRENTHIDAVLRAEAGSITCSGTVHGSELWGKFIFTHNPAFVSHMQQMGFGDLNSEKLEAYTLFRIDTPWIQSIKNAGVSGLDSDKLIALRIFKVDPAYIDSMKSLGYPVPNADKLVGLKVQNVNPAEVKEIRALGYQPTLDELIQMRIFKITPDFIHRMQARGLTNLTISKLVQIKIFKLDE